MNDALTVEVPYDCEVVGEHVADPYHLLVIGGDGQFYSLDIHTGQLFPTELSEQWHVDAYDISLRRRHDTQRSGRGNHPAPYR